MQVRRGFEVPFEDVQTTNILGFDEENRGVYMLDSRGRDTAALIHLSLDDLASTTIAESDQVDISGVVIDPRSHKPIAYAQDVIRPVYRALGVEFVEMEQGITRANQVAIMGGSYGGYATLVGLTFTPEEFSCGVDIVGPSNLVTLMESIPPYWESFRKIFARAIGDLETEEGQSLLKERSPLSRTSPSKALTRPGSAVGSTGRRNC